MSKALKYEVGDYFYRGNKTYYLDRISSVDGRTITFTFKERTIWTFTEYGMVASQRDLIENEITLHYNEIFKVFDRMSRDLICTELSYCSIHQISCSVSRKYLMERNKYLTLYNRKKSDKILIERN